MLHRPGADAEEVCNFAGKTFVERVEYEDDQKRGKYISLSGHCAHLKG